MRLRQMFINFFPTWLLVLMVIAGLLVFAFVCYKIIRAYFPEYLIKVKESSNIFMTLITISTILMAFTIVVLWQFYISTKYAVNQEALALNKIVLYSKGLRKMKAK